MQTPVLNTAMLPRHAPKEPSIWWLSTASPNRVATQRAPNSLAVKPLVGGLEPVPTYGGFTALRFD
jgi:hypothetical protein